MTLQEPYRLTPGLPQVQDYLRLRRGSGLTPCTPEQAGLIGPSTWRACHVTHDEDGVVGMGRVIGGGWYFHVVDMAVLPDHQRRGLGDAVLTWLMERIRTEAPPHAFVSLMADPPGRRLYERHGFTEAPEKSAGMALWT